MKRITLGLAVLSTTGATLTSVENHNMAHSLYARSPFGYCLLVANNNAFGLYFTTVGMVQAVINSSSLFGTLYTLWEDNACTFTPVYFN